MDNSRKFAESDNSYQGNQMLEELNQKLREVDILDKRTYHLRPHNLPASMFHSQKVMQE